MLQLNKIYLVSLWNRIAWKLIFNTMCNAVLYINYGISYGCNIT